MILIPLTNLTTASLHSELQGSRTAGSSLEERVMSDDESLKRWNSLTRVKNSPSFRWRSRNQCIASSYPLFRLDSPTCTLLSFSSICGEDPTRKAPHVRLLLPTGLLRGREHARRWVGKVLVTDGDRRSCSQGYVLEGLEQNLERKKKPAISETSDDRRSVHQPKERETGSSTRMPDLIRIARPDPAACRGKSEMIS